MKRLKASFPEYIYPRGYAGHYFFCTTLLAKGHFPLVWDVLGKLMAMSRERYCTVEAITPLILEGGEPFQQAIILVVDNAEKIVSKHDLIEQDRLMYLHGFIYGPSSDWVFYVINPDIVMASVSAELLPYFQGLLSENEEFRSFYLETQEALIEEAFLTHEAFTKIMKNYAPFPTNNSDLSD